MIKNKIIFIVILFGVSFEEINFETFFTSNYTEIFVNSTLEHILLSNEQILLDNFSLINQNNEKMKFEINNGAISNGRKISRVFFKNFYFLLKGNASYAIFNLSEVDSFALEDCIIKNDENIPKTFINIKGSLFMNLTNINVDLQIKASDISFFILLKNVKKSIFTMLNISNCFFSNFGFVKNMNSSILIENSLLHYSQFKQNSVWLFSNSIALLKDLSVFKNYFEGLFLSGEPSPESEIFLIHLNKTFFVNNYGISLFDVTATMESSEIHIYHSFFKFNFFGSSMVNFMQVYTAKFFNISLENNNGDHLIVVSTMVFAVFQNFLCLKNNEESLAKNLICGACIFSFNTAYVALKNVLIRECVSNIYTTGLIYYNIWQKFSFLHVHNSIFRENSFSSKGIALSYGGCIFTENILYMMINCSWFYDNILNLTKEIYGGVALFSNAKNCSLNVLNSFFEKNQGDKGSLTFEFFGYNITIVNSFFSSLSQIKSNQFSSFLIVGQLFFCTIRNSNFGEIQVNGGMLNLKDKSQTMIILDNVNIFKCFDGIAYGIFLGSETKNKYIEWKNSKIISNSDDNIVSFIFCVYIQEFIQSLKIRFFNNSIEGNSLTKGKSGIFFTFWTSSQNIYFFLENCNFSNNKNIFALASIYSSQIFIDVFVENCLFFNNTFQKLLEGQFLDILFKNNLLTANGFLAFITFYDSIFNLNNVCIDNITGAFYSFFSFSTSYSVNISNFSLENFAHTGNFYNGLDTQREYFSNIKFTNIACKNLFVFRTSKECLFYNFELSESNIYSILNVILKSNLQSSNMVIKNCEIVYALASKNNSNFNISNFFYVTSDLKMQSAFLILYDSIGYFNNSQFDFNFSLFSYPAFMIETTTINLKNCYFNFFPNENYLFQVKRGKMILENILIKNVYFYIRSIQASIEIVGSSFFNENIEYKIIERSNFYFENSPNFSLTYSNFSNIYSSYSTTFYVNNLNFKNLIFIKNCCFYKMVSENSNGGALYLKNTKAIIENCKFFNNFAYGLGGALFLDCSSLLNATAFCDFSLLGNIFIKNEVSMSGGSYFWNLIAPKSSNNIFNQNNAELWGKDYSSPTCRLGFHLVTKKNNEDFILFNSFETNSNDFLFIENKIFDNKYYLKFYKLDFYSQIILEHSSKTNERLEITINECSLNSSSNNTHDISHSNNYSIFGMTNPLFNKSSGYFLVDDLRIKGYPKTILCLKILMKFPSISTLSPLNFEKNNSKNEVYKGSQYFIYIPFKISECKEGYIFDQAFLTCVKCKEHYFSIDPNEKQCKKCPEKAYCSGGNLVQVFQNYWISSKSSLVFYKCDENIENCLGGDPFACALNYEGILCNVCKKDLHKNIFGACIICERNLMIGNGIFIIIFQLLIFYFCFFYSNINRSIEKKMALKLFCDYIHLVFLTQKYNRFILKSFYENFLIRIAFKWVSINCFLQILLPEYDIYFESFSKIYFFYLGFSLLFILNFIKKRRNFNAGFIYFYFSYPFILFEVLENLNCNNIENEDILVNDPRISCSSRNYMFLLYGFLIPSIFIFGCFVPLLFVYKTINRQTKNFRKTFKIIVLLAVFANIRNELKKNIHFIRNEFFIFCEKIALLLISALVFDEELKSFLHFLVLMVSFIIFMKHCNFHYIIKRINCYLRLIFMIGIYSIIFSISFFHPMLALIVMSLLFFMKFIFLFCCVYIFFRNSQKFLDYLLVKIFLVLLEKILIKKSKKEILYFQKRRSLNIL